MYRRKKRNTDTFLTNRDVRCVVLEHTQLTVFRDLFRENSTKTGHQFAVVGYESRVFSRASYQLQQKRRRATNVSQFCLISAPFAPTVTLY